jgi:hypothetical protein
MLSTGKKIQYLLGAGSLLACLALVPAAMGQMTAAGNPCAMNTSDGATNLAYRGTDGFIYLFDLEPGATTWHVLDISLISHAPAAIDDPSCAVRAYDGLNEFQYIAAATGHLWVIYRAKGAAQTTWQAADLTANAGGMIGRGGKTAAYNRTDGAYDTVYRGNNKDIILVEIASGSARSATDMTALVGATVPASGDPAVVAGADNRNWILYVGNDGHIYTIYIQAPGGYPWALQDLTGGNEPAVIGSSPSGYVRNDGQMEATYLGQDGHIYAIDMEKGVGSWTIHDLTAATGAPLAPINRALGRQLSAARRQPVRSFTERRPERDHLCWTRQSSRISPSKQWRHLEL